VGQRQADDPLMFLFVSRNCQKKDPIVFGDFFNTKNNSIVVKNILCYVTILDVTCVLSIISPLQVAQHVSGNHVPI